MSTMTMVYNQATQNQTNKGLSDKALDNLTAIEDEIELSSQYFKPKESKVYLLALDPEEKIIPRLNDRFKDAQGRPIIRYQIKISHVNSGKQQLWETSKTLCGQVVNELKKGFKVVQVQRVGQDRKTVYKVQGVQ
jgi:hypothetical protein